MSEIPEVKRVAIEAVGIALIDYTHDEGLIDTIARLRSRGVDVAFAGLEADGVSTEARCSGLLETLGANRVVHSVEEAVRNA